MNATIQRREIDAAGLRLHVLEAGAGEPLLLLHGWPTSSHLWRDVIPGLAEHRRVIAPDLPGFGRSDKPLDASYSFRFFERVLDALCKEMGVERPALAVHDLGGPLGLYWALAEPDRISALALLNTLVYPETSWAVKLFVIASYVPVLSDWMASPAGIAAGMKFGVAKPEKLTAEVLAPYQRPFALRDARRGLLKAAHGLHPGGFRQIAERLPQLDVPVCCVYGEQDRILPDVAQTMRRVTADLPQARVTALPDCGHFLQEDDPETVSRALVEWLQGSG